MSDTVFLDTVRSVIERHRMLRKGDRVLVGVSGGPDSLALFASLVALKNSYRLGIQAAYVNHGLRPSAALRESLLVRQWGHRWGVPVSVIRRAVRKQKGESLESAARRVRHEALAVLAGRHRCGVIALGHTQDDQAETILMWIIRGTGTNGLGGIPPVRRGKGKTRIIRPLLECSRAEIEGFLKSQGIKPLQDRSNRSGRFLRNRLRRELIPWIEQRYNPQFRLHLSRLAQILHEDRDWLQLELRQRFRQMGRFAKERVSLDGGRLRRESTAVRHGILRLAVERIQGDCSGFSACHWLALDRLLLTGEPHSMDLPHGLRAEKRKQEGIWIRKGR